MTAENKTPQGAWLKVFCPDARCLSPEEVADLPQEKKQAAQDSGKEGLWLEVFCPDGACLTDAEKGAGASAPSVSKADKGLWVNLFCPEGACLIDEESRLP